MSSHFSLHQLTPGDVPLMRALNALFGDAFADAATYGAEPPSDAYLQGRILTKDAFGVRAFLPRPEGQGLPRIRVTALVAPVAGKVVGGLVAYELEKFERARREMYIYDLGVGAEHRRRGIAAALIECLRELAAKRGVWVIFVQADYEDDPAIALYESLGSREEVLHFDIRVPGGA